MRMWFHAQISEKIFNQLWRIPSTFMFPIQKKILLKGAERRVVTQSLSSLQTCTKSYTTSKLDNIGCHH